jgi:hypothetical protein
MQVGYICWTYSITHLDIINIFNLLPIYWKFVSEIHKKELFLIFQIVVIILVVPLQLAYGSSGNSVHIDFFIGAQLHIWFTLILVVIFFIIYREGGRLRSWLSMGVNLFLKILDCNQDVSSVANAR